MGYYVSHMIGIQTGGVFSGDTDMDWLKGRIEAVARRLKADENTMPLDTDDISHCLSKELNGSKGSYVVLAGVFNYWSFDEAAEFAQALSAEFGTTVMHMANDHMTGTAESGMWDSGAKAPLPERPAEVPLAIEHIRQDQAHD